MKRLDSDTIIANIEQFISLKMKLMELRIGYPRYSVSGTGGQLETIFHSESESGVDHIDKTSYGAGR